MKLNKNKPVLEFDSKFVVGLILILFTIIAQTAFGTIAVNGHIINLEGLLIGVWAFALISAYASAYILLTSGTLKLNIKFKRIKK